MKSLEEIIETIQQEEKRTWGTYEKANKEGKCNEYTKELRAQHSAISNLMDELEIERMK